MEHQGTVKEIETLCRIVALPGPPSFLPLRVDSVEMAKKKWEERAKSH